MTKKSQAGLELMAIMAILIVFTASINNIFFKLNIDALKSSEREIIVSKCLDINTLISKVMCEPSLSASIDLGYNLTVNSTARLLVIFSGNDSYTCGLITSKLRNSTGSNEFRAISGARILKNNGQEVVII